MSEQNPVNLAKDRADFEVSFRGHLGFTSQDLFDARTHNGYANEGAQLMFTGFQTARNIQRAAEAAEEQRFAASMRTSEPVEKALSNLPINLINEIKWGGRTYDRPNSSSSGIRLSYVNATGNLWPVAFDRDSESVQYSVNSNMVGPDFIDLVFEIREVPVSFEVSKAEADALVLQITSDQYGPMIKTIIDLPLVGNQGSGVRAVLVRITVTHDDFLGEQV